MNFKFNYPFNILKAQFDDIMWNGSATDELLLFL